MESLGNDIRNEINQIIMRILKDSANISQLDERFFKPRKFEKFDTTEFGIFYLPNDYNYDGEDFGLSKLENRIIYTMYDLNKEPMGFVGWNKFAPEKYRVSLTPMWKANVSTFWGMEQLPEIYKDNKPVFFTEGIVCSLWLRLQGYHAMALLGSKISPYQEDVMKRLGRRVILVPDYDDAGNNMLRYAKSWCQGITIQVLEGKDIDGCRQIDEQTLLKELEQVVNRQFFYPFRKLKLTMNR